MVELDLHISSRLRKLLPGLTDEEKAQLKANIEADGRVTDPILYWHDGKQNVVVDGMHRFDIARRSNTPYHTEPIEIGQTYDDAELWILNRQLGRRNLISPEAQRKLRGELYNRLKGRHGGDRKSAVTNVAGSRSQIENLIGDPAEEIAEKAGVSPATVRRDGARVEALKHCTPAVQKGVSTGAIKPTDAELKAISKLAPEDQNAVATDLRKKEAGSVKESMKLRGIKAPGKPKPKKPPKLLDRKAYYQEWTRAIGPLVRTLASIAKGVGELHCPSHKVIVEHLDVCTEEMGEWMGVEK